MSDTSELELFFNRATFVPFIITTVDGYAISIDSPQSALMGVSMVVAKDLAGRLVHIPFGSIAHISEKGERLG